MRSPAPDCLMQASTEYRLGDGVLWSCVSSRIFLSDTENIVGSRRSVAREWGGASRGSGARRREGGGGVYTAMLPATMCERHTVRNATQKWRRRWLGSDAASRPYETIYRIRHSPIIQHYLSGRDECHEKISQQRHTVMMALGS